MTRVDKIYRNNMIILLFYIVLNEILSILVKNSYRVLPWQFIFFYLMFKYMMVILMLYFSIRYVKAKVSESLK